MNHQAPLFEWGTQYLVSQGYVIQNSPTILLATPWSNVIQFSTSQGHFFLKQVPPAISTEAKITQTLANQCHASVPSVIAINEDLHCFLMKDGGQNLRAYLKGNFQPELMCQAIKAYTTIQRSSEKYLESFFALGVPDWRLDKLPLLYADIINQEVLLKGDGVTDAEIQTMHDLTSKFREQCELLSEYPIPETIGISDINTNNVLMDTNTHKMTCIDWGEAVITHPFFSLHNYFYQAILHHPVKAVDQTYQDIQNASLENWYALATKSQLMDALMLAKKFWPLYSLLSTVRLINIISLEAFKTFYANRPNRLAGFIKDHIQCWQAR